MKKQELTYWVALALIPKMYTKRKNEIYVKCFNHTPQISIINLFEDASVWDIVELNEVEREQFIEAKHHLANTSFLVDELMAQGYDIIPIVHSEYPKALKENLKYNAPAVIYTKGNKALLQESSIAIVGSRNAVPISLTFTDNMAKKGVSEGKVVVSGFAKGVDQKALDSAVEVNGKSIIVLPQGIMTFGSGFKRYYKHIIEGRVLVISTFAPKAPWSVEFAMARNHIIYGLAQEIYVAQSDNNGGTWSGAIDGLRRGCPIFVRYPEKLEKNANLLLIQKGARAVNSSGQILVIAPDEQKTPEQRQEEKLQSDILSILGNVERVTAKELISRLDLDWKDDKMKRYLEAVSQIEKIKIKNRVYYQLKGKSSADLFSSIDYK